MSGLNLFALPGRRFRILTSVVLLALAGLLFLGFESAEPWSNELPSNPANYASHFFSAQAAALLDGRIDVPPSALPGECFMYQGHCYGYFGVTPSILRLPITVIDPTLGMTGVYLTLACLLGLGLSILIVNEIWVLAARRRPAGGGMSKWGGHVLFTASIAAVSFGSMYFQLTMPNVFQETIAWCTTSTLAGFWLLLKWFDTGRIWYLWLVVLALILAAGARPTGMVVSMALAVIIGLLIARDPRPWSAKVRHVVPVLMLVALPTGLAMAIFVWKFDSPLPDVMLNVQIGGGNPAWTAMFQANGGKFFSPQFLPTMLWAYIRPDSLMLLNGLPWFAAPVRVPPTPIGGYYLEPTASLTNLTPVALLLGLLAMVFTPIRRSGTARLPTPRTGFLGRWLVRGMILALLSGAALALFNIAGSNRYLGDFVPAAVAAVGFGSATIMTLPARRSALGRALVVIVVALMLVGVATNIGLSYAQINDRVIVARDVLLGPSWPWGRR
jgi:hypothetical protein